jgi:ABC transporter, ATP-binding protein
VEYVKNIGVVFGQRTQLWWDIPVIDSFELLKDIYSVPQNLFQNNLEELINLLELKEIVKTPARQLSLGQRMKCEIAASLLHSPKILFLDEPTIGLDALSKLTVRKFISELNKKNKTTIILTTHDMQDIEAITERIILSEFQNTNLQARKKTIDVKFLFYKFSPLQYFPSIYCINI